MNFGRKRVYKEKFRDVIYCVETGKISHPSRGKAEAALRAIKKQKEEYQGHVYPCIYCQGFHFGRNQVGIHQSKFDYEKQNKNGLHV